MKTTAIFLLLLGLTMASGDTTPNKSNQLEAKKVHQVTKPAGIETASTRTHDLQIAHMQYRANQGGNGHNQDLELSQRSQLQNSQFHNQDQVSQFHDQNQASQLHSQDLSQQFHNQDHPQPFHNQDHAQQFHNREHTQQFRNQDHAQRFQAQNQAQQFHMQDQTQQLSNQGQIIPGSPVHHDQELPSVLQSQQQKTPAGASLIQSQPRDQMQDISAQQQLYSTSHPQQGFYQDRKNVLVAQDGQSEGRFDDSSRQHSQLFSGLQSTQLKTGGLSQAYNQLSAFDNRMQPIMLPRISQAHSASVVVSGLKNLPSLPALVYSAGAVPTTPVLAYSRPWHQGGAYVRQHWQTPYARYVYSHIL